MHGNMFDASFTILSLESILYLRSLHETMLLCFWRTSMRGLLHCFWASSSGSFRASFTCRYGQTNLFRINMEAFYLTYEEFWKWFNRDPSEDDRYTFDTNQPKLRSRLTRDNQFPSENQVTGIKRPRSEGKPRSILETEAATRTDARYIIMYGRPKPGKKNKVWEGDGYLSLVGQMAHLCDLKGRMLEEPTYLDDIDLKSIEDFGELTIGGTEVQVVEADKK